MSEDLSRHKGVDEYSRDGLVVHYQSLIGVISGGAACFCNAGGYTELACCLAELFGRYLFDVDEITDQGECLGSESEF